MLNEWLKDREKAKEIGYWSGRPGLERSFVREWTSAFTTFHAIAKL
jgi:hypothetical protein